MIILGEGPRITPFPSLFSPFFSTKCPSLNPVPSHGHLRRTSGWPLLSPPVSLEYFFSSFFPHTSLQVVQKYAGRKLLLRCPVGSPVPCTRFTHSFACPPGRNNKSCRKRWLHSLDPNLRKGENEPPCGLTLPFFTPHVGRWTSEEDAVLLKSVAKYGKRWYEVARALPGRTDDQCAKRYKEAVDPSISRCKYPLPS